METITFQSEVWKELLEKLQKINNRISETNTLPEEKWLDNQGVMELLHCSKRTLQTYRDGKRINFSQVGNKIYYRYSDVMELIYKYYNGAKLDEDNGDRKAYSENDMLSFGNYVIALCEMSELKLAQKNILSEWIENKKLMECVK